MKAIQEYYKAFKWNPVLAVAFFGLGYGAGWYVTHRVADADQATLRAEKAAVQAEVKTAETKQEALRLRGEQLEGTIKRRDEELARCSSEVTGLKQSQEQAVKSCEGKATDARGRSEESGRQAKAAQGQLSALVGELDHAKRDLKECKGQHETLVNRQQSCEAEREALRTRPIPSIDGTRVNARTNVVKDTIYTGNSNSYFNGDVSIAVLYAGELFRNEKNIGTGARLRTNAHPLPSEVYVQPGQQLFFQLKGKQYVMDIVSTSTFSVTIHIGEY